MFEFIHKHKKGAATAAAVGAAAVGLGAGIAANKAETSSEPVKTANPTEEISKATTTTEVSEPLTTAPSETTVTVEAVTTTTQETNTAETKLSLAEVEAALRNPVVGQQTRYANNIYNARPDAVVRDGLGEQAAAVQTGGWFGSPEIIEMPDGTLVACSTETSNDPQNPSLQIRCTDAANLIDMNGSAFDANDMKTSSVSYVGENGDAYTADPAIPGYESEFGHAIRGYANETDDTSVLPVQG